MTFEEFLGRCEQLGEVRMTTNGYDVICPAHEDTEPSLSIAEGEEGILLKCRAGCSTDAVVTSMGLSMRDLFFNSINYSEPEAAYSYTDEAGNELYQAVRFPGKVFRQRHKGHDDEWIWDLKDVRRVLYHLPEVIAQAAVGGTVYFCEGEKDVERLRSLGKVATCNPMGAGKWRPEFAASLAGANVIIVADRDEPGRNHAEAVKNGLIGFARGVYVVQARQGKDVSDHLDAGFEINQLVPRRERIRRGIVTARELAEGGREDLVLNERDIPSFQLAPYVSGFPGFRQGRMYTLGAYTGHGKTGWALQAADYLGAAGVSFGYFTTEMPERDLRNRLIAHRGVPLSVTENPWRLRNDPVTREKYLAALEDIEKWNAEIIYESGIDADKVIEITRDREYEVVFIDHIHRFGWGRERRGLEEQVNALTNLALDANICVVILCQLRKHMRGKDTEAFPKPTIQDFRETSALADDSSMALALWRQTDGGGLTYTGVTELYILKNRHTTGTEDSAGRGWMPKFDLQRQMFIEGASAFQPVEQPSEIDPEAEEVPWHNL